MIVTSDTNIELPTLPGRDYQAAGIGTFGGATVALQTYVDGEWRAVPDGSWTASFEIVRTNGDGSALRLVTTSTSGTTSISLNLTEIPQ